MTPDPVAPALQIADTPIVTELDAAGLAGRIASLADVVTFEFEAGGGVVTVMLECEGWPLLDAPIAATPPAISRGEQTTITVLAHDPDSADTLRYTYEVTASADLAIEKEVLKDEICLGAYGLYEIVVENAGPAVATGARVVDPVTALPQVSGASWTCAATGPMERSWSSTTATIRWCRSPRRSAAAWPS